MIQSILLPKNKFTLSSAKKWLKEHGYKVSYYGKPIHETQNYYRARQEKPIKGKKYRIKELSDGIKFTLMF